MEEAARYDRAMAIALSQGRNPPPRPQPRIPSRQAQEATLERLRTRVPHSSGSVTVPTGPAAAEPHKTTSKNYNSSDVAIGLVGRPPSLGFSAELWDGIASTNPTVTSPLVPSDDDEGSDEPSHPGSPDLEYAMRVPSFPPSRSVSPGPSVAPPIISNPIPQCIVCLSHIDDGPVIRVACGHHLDVTCLRTMFGNATKDVTLFPPRCCGELGLDEVQEHLDAALVSRFRQKAVEFRTKDPVYCSNQRCSVFLRGATPTVPTPIECTECTAMTCCACKREAHPGQTCESSRLDEAVLSLAKAERWTRCPSCHFMVERISGCPHMVCRCQAQFCYLCAAVWGTCRCTL
ncbi:hypothetical protein L227DRAFT_415707 [Lentinus tigrinus ALCF2SS1-6]|uniref:RBR-type E3 ubiquitin transferase n=1 Tax=Lentinus tigrinus ALCF2SS1-6 TaxID=1328759 RepID=A0A5C2SNV7_9APHY|nr:hypothetical protein L227DRAFT_415707 [Lentinus tigrinus ALCF2SS1-6]